MFLKEGRFCASLNEECCFYTDCLHWYGGRCLTDCGKGWTRDNGNGRWKELGFQSCLFPWLATLLMALAGPLILLLFFVALGPCVINRLVDMVKSRFNAVVMLSRAVEDIVDKEDSKLDWVRVTKAEIQK